MTYLQGIIFRIIGRFWSRPLAWANDTDQALEKTAALLVIGDAIKAQLTTLQWLYVPLHVNDV